MISTPKVRTPQLLYLEASALAPIVHREVIENDHTVREAVELHIAVGRRPVIEKEHGALAADKELFERENLTPKAQRVAGEQPHFGERIDDHSRRAMLLDGLEDDVHRLLKLDLGRMEERVGLVGPLRLYLGQLNDVDVVEGPAVGCGGARSSSAVSDERDVHARARPRHAR